MTRFEGDPGDEQPDAKAKAMRVAHAMASAAAMLRDSLDGSVLLAEFLGADDDKPGDEQADPEDYCQICLRPAAEYVGTSSVCVQCEQKNADEQPEWRCGYVSPVDGGRCINPTPHTTSHVLADSAEFDRFWRSLVGEQR